MQKLGALVTIIGLVAVLVGLGAGFWKLFGGSEDALFWLSLIPFGFIELFVSITLTQLSKR